MRKRTSGADAGSGLEGGDSWRLWNGGSGDTRLGDRGGGGLGSMPPGASWGGFILPVWVSEDGLVGAMWEKHLRMRVLSSVSVPPSERLSIREAGRVGQLCKSSLHDARLASLLCRMPPVLQGAALTGGRQPVKKCVPVPEISGLLSGGENIVAPQKNRACSEKDEIGFTMTLTTIWEGSCCPLSPSPASGAIDTLFESSAFVAHSLLLSNDLEGGSNGRNKTVMSHRSIAAIEALGNTRDRNT